jgi:hypothetical protein
MQDPATPVIPARRLWLGRSLTGLTVLFLMGDAFAKVVEAAPAVRGTVELGYPPGTVVAIGLIELACVAAYLAPPTALVGAVLLTGYLGGAVATHVRAGSPLASATLFPLYVAAFVWGGLALRDARVRALWQGRAR